MNDDDEREAKFSVPICKGCRKRNGEKYDKAHGIFMGRCARCTKELDDRSVIFVEKK